jgi:two-component system C4-dicarboxylate transport response regulator DctD
VVAHNPDIPVVLISGHADVRTAVRALRQGACDVLEKPFVVDQLIASIERALERRRLVIENARLRAAPDDADDGPLLGRSPAMEQLRRSIAQIAPMEIDVLIQGETGTGKGVVARCRRAFPRPSCSAMSRAPCPATPCRAPGGSSRRTAAPCSSTTSMRCRKECSSACSACWNAAR